MDWKTLAGRAYENLNVHGRVYDVKRSIELIDDLAKRHSVTRHDIEEAHGKRDFVQTVLGHVTTAVHGEGNVPIIDGWYRTLDEPYTYVIHPEFAAAWRTLRKMIS